VAGCGRSCRRCARRSLGASSPTTGCSWRNSWPGAPWAIDFLEEAIAELQAEIEPALAPFTAATELLQTIPGVGAVVAAALVAEIGTDPTRFASAKHLASWAGGCPGNKQSAGEQAERRGTSRAPASD
jgi:transposase IS116/IS110/IS902 family protein